MKILLIEPDEYYHSHFKTHFADLGEVVVCKSGSEGRGLLRSAKPDALVMELLLEDLSGYEILDELIASQGRGQIPVIIYSKIANVEDMEQTLNRGVNGYFVKGRDSFSDVKKLLLAYIN